MNPRRYSDNDLMIKITMTRFAIKELEEHLKKRRDTLIEARLRGLKSELKALEEEFAKRKFECEPNAKIQASEV